MDSTDKLFAIFYCLAALVIITISVSIAAVNINANNTWERMIKGGVDPMRAACALDSRPSFCAVLAGVAGK